MGTYIAHPVDEAQDNALKAIFEALKIPYEAEPLTDETEFLLSSEANKKRLLDAIANEGKGSRTIDLDEVWK